MINKRLKNDKNDNITATNDNMNSKERHYERHKQQKNDKIGICIERERENTW